MCRNIKGGTILVCTPEVCMRDKFWTDSKRTAILESEDVKELARIHGRQEKEIEQVLAFAKVEKDVNSLLSTAASLHRNTKLSKKSKKVEKENSRLKP
eukprot:UN15846